jgi:site-specific DNA recombinase
MPHHLDREAVFYGRQSTPEQVETNIGSADYQRAQTRHARTLGWSEDHILWFDDFGKTGAAAEHRPQYQELRRLVQEGRVGLVGVTDLSRLSRNAAELTSFIGDCVSHNVLICIDGELSDPRDPSDRSCILCKVVGAVLGQLELGRRIHRVRRNAPRE